MKRKLFFLLILFIIFIVAIGVRFLISKNSAKQGKVHILASPEANVVIDNKAVGKTPYQAPLDEGEYLVKLIPDAKEASDSASWNGKIKIYRNTLTFMSRELGASDIASSGVIFNVRKMEKKPEKKDTGEIEVSTEPDGAVIFLDNDEQGITPLVLSEVPQGDHELSVLSPGFFRRSQKVKVVSGFRVIAAFKLAIDPSHKNIADEVKSKEATKSAELKQNAEKIMLTIKETDTGWLRVRTAPSLSASESARVEPGQTFAMLDEEAGWYKISYEKNKEGWISSNYAEKTTPTPEPSGSGQ